MFAYIWYIVLLAKFSQWCYSCITPGNILKASELIRSHHRDAHHIYI